MSGGGSNSNGQGGAYNPTQTGALFGTKLNEYLTGTPPVFGKSMFSEPGKNTLDAQNLIRGQAYTTMQGGAFPRAFNFTDKLLGSGGFAPGMQADIGEVDRVGNAYRSMADGAANPSLIEGTYGNIQRSLRTPSYAETGFRSMAGVPGTSLTEQRFGNDTYGTSSPAYQTLRKKLMDDVTTNNLSAFNSSGLFGSDDNKESLAEGLGTALAGADMEQMRYGDALGRGDVQAIEAARQRGLDNRTRALGAADAARLDQLGARMGALGAEDASAAGRFNRRLSSLGGELGAATGSYGMRQGGINNALTASGSLGDRYADMLLPGQTIAGVGAQQDATGQGRLLGEADLFDRSNNAGYNRMLELLGAFTGSQGAPGMTEKVPLWQQLLGFVGQNAGRAIGAYGQ